MESIETDPAVEQHICFGDLVREDGLTIEECTAGVTLTADEESSSAYVAGWLEPRRVFHELNSLLSCSHCSTLSVT